MLLASFQKESGAMALRRLMETKKTPNPAGSALICSAQDYSATTSTPPWGMDDDDDGVVALFRIS
ncbi:MAG: hypothetical protein ACI9JE_001765 [Candidatus Krumholzibacteriia bacterium]|jgi:hypothetical protein